MTQISARQTARQDRRFAQRQLSPEEKAQQEIELKEIERRSQEIFERIKPELIKDYYDWFMAIEPDSGDYFIDEDEDVALQKAREKYPNAWCAIFCINETGACCRV